ncbi:MAG: phosphomannomutase/phosphoglucomutase [Selenomonas ruminantium]|uniref:Phosphomannomutase/phosphoglucomutase n=1 Tax=Selenomonas ruminantium TaxID=971 RepID=A0A927WKP2_SELRU|nr:phosphomannomutase/phosphoglucomutase [Selenomonas ruminantium]
MDSRSCFGAYDIRGTYPNQVNENMAYRIGRFLPALLQGKKIALGHDMRLSGQSLNEYLARGLQESGCSVYDIGLCGTEMVYFAVPYLDLDGGIMITASHNPKEYNGMKFVKRESVPLERELFRELERQVREDELHICKEQGTYHQRDIMTAYVEKLLSYVDISVLKPYKIVVNAGNGMAGQVIDAIEKRLPFELVKVDCNPDGTFPRGVPNPLLSENQIATAKAVIEHRAHFGVAWDGDFDRCFIYDERGRFIDACYIVGFLAEAFLGEEKGAGIVYDNRVIYNIEDIIALNGGTPLISKGGHVIFKARMRETGAIYGGEMSGHHYFRNFYYCDSGMIPWLMVAELLSKSGKKLSELLDERMEKFPVSGEKNIKTGNSMKILDRIEALYEKQGSVSKIDGLSVNMKNWRFNLRASNTEPLLRLNVESCGDKKKCLKKCCSIIKEISLL